MNYLLLGLIIICIWFFTKKENFTDNAKLDTFLNTWHLTNEELKNSLTVGDNSVKVTKAFNTKNDSWFPFHDNQNYIRGTNTIVDTPLNVNGDIWMKNNKVEAKQICIDGWCLDSGHADWLRKASAGDVTDEARNTNQNSKGNGAIDYLDRHSVYCNKGEFLRGFKLEVNGSGILYRFHCGKVKKN